MSLDLQIQRPLRELVYLELKRKILTGEITADTRLMEINLSERMNVSRTPIRDAIRQLAKDGLVTIEPRRGAYVSKISIKDMVDVFEVREDLEGLAAYLAAQRITEEGKIELRELTKQYERAVLNEDKEALVHYDEKFHSSIVGSCDNEVLKEMFEHIRELSMRFRYIYYGDFSHYEKMPAEHTRIMNAICSGDAKKAREEADSHVKAIKEFVMEIEQRQKAKNSSLDIMQNAL